MARRKKKIKKNIEIDPIYKEESVNKLMNYVMINGKKNKALKIFRLSPSLIQAVVLFSSSPNGMTKKCLLKDIPDLE